MATDGNQSHNDTKKSRRENVTGMWHPVASRILSVQRLNMKVKIIIKEERVVLNNSRERLRRVPFKNILRSSFPYSHHIIIISSSSSSSSLFFLRLPIDQDGPVSKMSIARITIYHCTGPFNCGEAHCAGEKGKRKRGPVNEVTSTTNQEQQ